MPADRRKNAAIVAIANDADPPGAADRFLDRDDLALRSAAATAAVMLAGHGGDPRDDLTGDAAGTGDLPRAFRTADLRLIHAADCCSRYSSWTCCGVRYCEVRGIPGASDCTRIRCYLTTSRRACSRVGLLGAVRHTRFFNAAKNDLRHQHCRNISRCGRRTAGGHVIFSVPGELAGRVSCCRGPNGKQHPQPKSNCGLTMSIARWISGVL